MDTIVARVGVYHFVPRVEVSDVGFDVHDTGHGFRELQNAIWLIGTDVEDTIVGLLSLDAPRNRRSHIGDIAEGSRL